MPFKACWPVMCCADLCRRACLRVAVTFAAVVIAACSDPTGTTEGCAQTVSGGSALAADFLREPRTRRPSDHPHFPGELHRTWEGVRGWARPRGNPAAHRGQLLRSIRLSLGGISRCS
jgi:hypothetical protein